MTKQQLIEELKAVDDSADLCIGYVGHLGKIEVLSIQTVILSNQNDLVFCSNNVNQNDVANGNYNK